MEEIVKETNLTEYILERTYSKTDSYNRVQLDTILESIRNKELDLIEIVLELPTQDIKSNKIYLKYNNSSTGGDLFDVYLYVNGDWERLDGLPFNITDYYNSNQIDNLLVSKASTRELNNTINSLNVVETNLTSLYNNLTDFNEELISFSEDNNNLDDDLSKLKDNLSIFIDRVKDLITDLTGLQTVLNGDDDNPGLRSEVNTLKTQTTSLNTGLDTLREGLCDASGELKLTADDILAYNTQLTQFLNDLSTLSTYASDFEGSLAEFQQELNSHGVSFDVLESNMVNLFASIGVVKSDITDLQDTAETIQDDVSTVNTTLYGDGGDETSYTATSVLGTMETVQGNITTVQDTIGDENKGLIKTINTVDSKADDALDSINDVTDILYGDGDSEHPSNNTVLKDISNVKTGVETAQDHITEVQSQMYKGESGTGTTTNPATGTIMDNINITQDNIGQAKNNINRLDESLQYTQDDVGTVQRTYAGNLQDQMATLLEMISSILNCQIVETEAKKNNLNNKYVKYCYVLETGKFYEYKYEVHYYDSNNNEVLKPTEGTEILLESDSSDSNSIGDSKLWR